MNASRTDHPLTRPVALRTKSVRSAGTSAAAITTPFRSLPKSRSRCRWVRLLSAAGQHEVLDLLAVQLDERAQQLSLFVRAAGVDDQGVANPGVPAGLVDVAVQREHRPELLDRAAHRLGANGLGRVAA